MTFELQPGPATTLLTLALHEEGGGTRLRVRDTRFGHVDETAVASQRKGWLELFTNGLKRHVEG